MDNNSLLDTSPKPTRDLELAKKDLDKFGFCFIPNVLIEKDLENLDIDKLLNKKSKYDYNYFITKHNYLIKNIKDLEKIINEAFYIAQSGRPGPVPSAPAAPHSRSGCPACCRPRAGPGRTACRGGC